MAQTFLVFSSRREKRQHHSCPRLWGFRGTDSLWGLELQKLLERLEQGPVWEGPVSELKRGQGRGLGEQVEQRH